MEDMLMRDKKMIKKDILDKFRSVSENNNPVIPMSWLEGDYYESLSWEERFVFKKAVNELIKKGIVENINGSESNLKLTPKGFDLLFCCT